MENNLNILQVDGTTTIVLYTKVILLTVTTIQKIETVGTIEKAKTKLQSRKFDFVILGSIPHENGIEFLKWIKKNYPTIIVILFSNDPNPKLRLDAEKARADYFLEKPMGFKSIIQILKKHNPAIPNYEGIEMQNICYSRNARNKVAFTNFEKCQDEAKQFLKDVPVDSEVI